MFYVRINILISIFFILPIMIAQENNDTNKQDLNYIWQSITEDQQVFDFPTFRMRVFQKEEMLLVELVSKSPIEVTESFTKDDENKKCTLYKIEGSISNKSWEKIDNDYVIEVNTCIGSLTIRETLNFARTPVDYKSELEPLVRFDIKKNSMRIMLQQGIFKFCSLQEHEIYFYHFGSKSYFRIAEENIIDLATFFLESQKENASTTKRPGSAH